MYFSKSRHIAVVTWHWKSDVLFFADLVDVKYKFNNDCSK